MCFSKVVFAGDAAVGKTSFINRQILWKLKFILIESKSTATEAIISIIALSLLITMITLFRITKITMITTITLCRITKGVFMSNLSSTLGVDFQVRIVITQSWDLSILLYSHSFCSLLSLSPSLAWLLLTKGEDHQSGRPEYRHSTVGHCRSFSFVTVSGIDKVKTSDKNIAQAKRDSEVSQKPTSAELTGWVEFSSHKVPLKEDISVTHYESTNKPIFVLRWCFSMTSPVIALSVLCVTGSTVST